MRRILLLGGSQTASDTVIQQIERENARVVVTDYTPDAVEMLAEWMPQLVVADYAPAAGRGLEPLSAVRKADPLVRMLLIGEEPLTPNLHDLLHRLDVDGMWRSTDSLESLRLWVRSGLRNYEERAAQQRRRDGLRRMHEMLRGLHRSAPAEKLVQMTLEQLQEVVGDQHHVVGAMAAPHAQSKRLHAGPANWKHKSSGIKLVTTAAGRGRSSHHLLPSLSRYMHHKEVSQDGHRHYLPLHDGRESLGVICLEHAAECGCDPELLRIVSLGIRQALEIRRLTHLVCEDELTQAFTRQFFFRMAETAVQNACRDGHPIALAIFDVDFFKRVNDSAGHLAGDRLLRELTDLMRTNLRPQDILGRFGGDEFMLALPRTSGEVATEVLERLRARVQDTFGEGKVEFPVSISCGVIGLDATPLGEKQSKVACCAANRIVHKMLEEADRLLYLSKARGRNCVTAGTDFHLPVLSVQLGLPNGEKHRHEQPASLSHALA